uniref:Uncharacterized protein n=1 Tax=Rhizophora mucronata TaxID=61149 RepID=A0A2P2QN11_RHIMU
MGQAITGPSQRLWLHQSSDAVELEDS